VSEVALNSLGQETADLALTVNETLGSVLERAQFLLRTNLPPIVERELRRIEETSLECRASLRDAVSHGRREAPRSVVVDPEGLLLRAVEWVEPRARSAGVRITVGMDTDLPRVVGDPVALEHVVLLALLGALQEITGHCTEIHLMADEVWEFDVPQLRVTISDDRPGAPLGEMPHLGFPGNGLGLDVVRDVIVDHGGRFEMSSGKSGGLTVTLTLPGVTGTFDLPDR